MTSEKVMYIHIPSDVLEESNPYRCPTTVNLELRDQHNSPRRRSVGVYPPLSSRTAGSESASSVFVCDTARGSRTQAHTSEGCLRGKAMGTPSTGNYSRKKLPDSRLDRVMDANEDSNETPDGVDLIEAVAQANEALSSATALPRLQSSPCPIHTRTYQQQHHLPMYRQQQLQQHNYTSMEPRNDLLYSTNCHGGQVRRSSSQASGNSGRRSNKSNTSGELRRQEEERVKMEREKTFRQDVLAGKAQRYFRPILPNEMPSQHFVSTWIIHGSQPEGRSHFPDLLPDSKNDPPGLPIAADSNKGKKQTLRPIQAMAGEYAKGVRGNSIPITENRPK